jgi:hypothetical protein
MMENNLVVVFQRQQEEKDAHRMKQFAQRGMDGSKLPEYELKSFDPMSKVHILSKLSDSREFQDSYRMENRNTINFIRICSETNKVNVDCFGLYKEISRIKTDRIRIEDLWIQEQRFISFPEPAISRNHDTSIAQKTKI